MGTTEKQPEEKLIKVRLPGESLWAVDLGEGKAELRNAPFNDGYSLFDIVKIDSDGKVLEMIERKYRPVQIKYECTEENIDEEWKKLCEYVHSKNMHIEGFVAGYAGLSVPKEVTDEELKKLLDDSPVKIEAELS